jgi:hypothetical protein
LEATSEDSCLGVLQGSHYHTEEFLTLFPHHCFNYPLYNDEWDWFQEKGCKVARIASPRGSLVIWDSKTFHAPLASLLHHSRKRLVVYIRYFPTNAFPMEKREKAIETPDKIKKLGLDFLVPNEIKREYAPLFFGSQKDWTRK